jgi:hypothetical protein
MRTPNDLLLAAGVPEIQVRVCDVLVCDERVSVSVNIYASACMGGPRFQLLDKVLRRPH